MRDSPIGIFDSGVGGLNVLGECLRLMPNEDYIYLADKANMPYGEKCEDDIIRAASGCTDTLMELGCKAVAIACNTATAVASDAVRSLYPERIIVGLEPAVKPCLRELGRRGKAVALVTRATAASDKFKRLIASDGRISAVAAPELAGLIEGMPETAFKVRAAIKKYLDPYKGVEAVVLGCSHYSIAKRFISEALGSVKIYDGAAGEAERLRYCLSIAGLMSMRQCRGSVRFMSTYKI